LRGPQGTLYGASSLGGLIKFVTVDPSTDAFSGRVQAGLNSIENGDDVGYNVRGSVNVPLGDTLALRASGFERHDAGYIDNPGLGLEGVNKSKAKGGRFAAMWRPSDRFSLKLNALLQDIQQQGSSFSTLQAGFDDLEQQAALGTGRLDRKSQVYSAQLNARLGIVDLTSISGYILNKIDSVLNSGGGLAIPFNLDGKKLTQEIRISAPIGERLNWMLGAFYTHEKSPSRQYIADVDPVTGALSLSQDVPFDIPYNTQYEEYAAFANLTWQVTDRLDVQFGGRQSEIRQVYDQITLFGGTVIRDSHGVANENAFTYLVTPRLKLSNDLMVYARFASGYRPGGNTANATLFNLPPTYDADETQNYEIGVKGNALEGKLSFDASLFYIDWKDMQVIAGNSSGFSWVENAGGADSKGVELTVESRPLKGMRISGWLVYNEAALSQDFPTPANTFSVVGLSGDRLPFISRVSGNLSLDQDFPLGNEVTGFVGGSVSYVGDRNDNFAVLANPTRFDLPSYTQVDLLGGVRYGSWTASLFANNVLDKRGTLSVDPRVANSIYYIQPRTLGLSLAKTF
jgi:outer membrane receptor protein involved in Fe transport